MTTPDPTADVMRRARRELIGLVLAVVGLLALLGVLATVDWRLPVGVLAAAAIAVGALMTVSKE